MSRSRFSTATPRPTLHVIAVFRPDPDLVLRARWERQLVETHGADWVAANRARLDLELEFVFGTGPTVPEPRRQGARRAKER